MPIVSALRSVAGMIEGTARIPGARAAEYQRAHPETGICQVDGVWRAWKPEPGDPFSGEMAHGRTEDELLAKLGAPAT